MRRGMRLAVMATSTASLFALVASASALIDSTHVSTPIGISAAASGALHFDPPTVAGTTGFPSDFQGLGGGYVLGRNGDDGWRGSIDGGKTWSEVLKGQHFRGDAPGYHAVVLASPGVFHNMGNVTAVADRDAGYTSFSSTFVQLYRVADQSGSTPVWSTQAVDKAVTFDGLPDPVTCGNSKHLFGCPFRTDGIGHVRLADGSLVMSIVVYWGGTHASHNASVRAVATSVVAFRSDDGYSWSYAGTILDAAGVPTSEEGPNQNDLVLLADNTTLMCVMRVDSGEGPSMRYSPLARSFSADGGTTWSKPESFGAGFATGHPRLMRTRDGQVLLSSNQLTPTDRDLLLYRNEAGDGKTWQPHSISYWHNALVPDPALRFTPAVNSSPAVPRHGEITGLTSLIRTDAQAGVLLYSRTLQNKSLTFAMRFHVTSPSPPPSPTTDLSSERASALIDSTPIAIVNVYDADLFRFSVGDPGHCVGEQPKCGSLPPFNKSTKQLFTLAPGANYLSIGGGIKTTKDGSVCHTWLSDDTFCSVYPGSVEGDCSRLSIANCTRVGTSLPITYAVSATIDRTCDTLPYEDCTVGKSVCCGAGNICQTYQPGVKETKCWPKKKRHR